MSTSAIITMVLVQGAVTAVIIYIYYLVMNPKDKPDQNNQEDTD